MRMMLFCDGTINGPENLQKDWNIKIGERIYREIKPAKLSKKYNI
jgi:hypothetical protein